MSNRFSRICDGVMEAAWLAALVLAPLFFNIYSSRVFEPDKIALVRSLALITLAAWGMKVISMGGVRFTHLSVTSIKDFLRIPMVVPIGLLIIVYLIATIFSVAPRTTFYGSYQRLQGTFSTFSYLILAAALMANLRRRSQAERLITTVIITSLPIAFYGVLQRFRLDPLPWGGDTIERVTANMGNAIFLGAYLIMSAMLTLGRIVTSFHTILTEESNKNLPINVIRAAIYILIFALNVLAIYWSGSRGPWLGGLAGLFAFFLFLALYWRVRWLTLTTIGLAATAGVFLVLLNIPNGPLESIRAIPGIGRLGTVFETEGGTGRVRTLIWEGVVDLVLPHEPLSIPGQGNDALNFARTFIGYGPEALYVAYNRFYPPELGQIEARNASPDRSHNETFDALAFTGVFGLMAYLALFVSVFYYGMKWQGLITSAGQRNLFLGLTLGGGAVTTVGLVMWRGPEFFGVGLPFGMLLGLIAFITLYALWMMPRLTPTTDPNAPVDENTPNTPNKIETWRAIALISLFAGVLAHFTEIHFGIAIASTRTHFWLFTALIAVLGFIFPLMQHKAGPNKENTAAETPRRSRLSRDTRREDKHHDESTTLADWIPTLVGASIITLILFTLGYDFITNATRIGNAMEILAGSFTKRPGNAALGEPQFVESYAVMGMIMLSWLAGGILLLLEEAANARSESPWAIVGAGLMTSMFVAFIGWISLSGHLANVVGLQVTDLRSLLASVGTVAGIMALFYFLVFLVVIAQSLVLSEARGDTYRGSATNLSPLALLGYVALPIIAVLFSIFLNLQMVQADIIYKTGLQFDDSGQPDPAIQVYIEALRLSPQEDYYYLFLGRAYLNATNTQAAQENPEIRNQYLKDAEAQLLEARLLNPLNTDHTANLARLSRQWAAIATDEITKQDRIQKATDYYSEAVSLSPKNAGLWNEWAALEMQMKGNVIKTQELLSISMALDTKFDMTHQLQGDVYVTQAEAITDTVARKPLYDQALVEYQTCETAAEARGGRNMQCLINTATVYQKLQDIPNAIAALNVLVNINDASLVKWQLYYNISQLYAQQSDWPNALTNAQLAYQAADEATRPNIQPWLDQLQTLLNTAPAPTPAPQP